MELCIILFERRCHSIFSNFEDTYNANLKTADSDLFIAPMHCTPMQFRRVRETAVGGKGCCCSFIQAKSGTSTNAHLSYLSSFIDKYSHR
jgi:hypothetical protein